MDYLYLHGFASSPQSRKAQRLQARFQTLGLTLHVLDLNQDDFTGLTLRSPTSTMSGLDGGAAGGVSDRL
jgi:hypothetical protein